MGHLLQGLLVSALIVAVPNISRAANPQYRCEPNTVANDAVAIAFPDVDVGAYSDPDNDRCTFAIGGASIDGPVKSADVPPIAEIIHQARSGNSLPLSLRLLIARSAMSGDVDDLSKTVAEVLGENLPQLDLCISALEKFSDGPPDPITTSENEALVYMNIENDIVSVQCMIFPPGERDVIRSAVPTLLLYSRSKGKSDSLFVPNTALQ